MPRDPAALPPRPPVYDIPLAWTEEGDRAPAPDGAAGWRVRSSKPGPGRPAAVYGRDGLPVWLPLDADVEALAHAAERKPGRYRLDWLDNSHEPIPGATPCYVFVREGALVSDGTRNASTDPRDHIMVSQLRTIQEMASTLAQNNAALVSHLGPLVAASAIVVQAADGAGIAHRAPMPVAPSQLPGVLADEDDGDATSATVALVQELRAFLTPLAADYLASRRPSQSAHTAASLPEASPPAAPRNAPQGAAPNVSEPAVSAPAPRTHADDFLGHPRAHEVLAQLTREEQAAARAMIHRLPADKLPTLLHYLVTQPLDAAVDLVRRHAATTQAAAEQGRS